MFATLLIPITALFFVLAFSGNPAEAQKMMVVRASATAGTLPIGSCARGGTTYARDVTMLQPEKLQKEVSGFAFPFASHRSLLPKTKL